MNRKARSALGVALALVVMAAIVQTQTGVTSPKAQFGFNIGDDYHLANYAQLTEYWHTLERESDRMTLVEIGKTAEGRAHLMAIIMSPLRACRA